MFITDEMRQTKSFAIKYCIKDWTLAAVPLTPPSSLWANYGGAQAGKRLSDECVMKDTTYSTSLNKL